jgi:Cys-rich repeat protein
MASRRVFFAISWLLAGGLSGGIVGCFPPDEGRPVPLDRIYFPVGIALSPKKSWMYVANSDFDLQYNAGTVQVYDLAKLRRLVPRYCRTSDDCASGKVCDADAIGTTAPTHRCVDDPKDPNPCPKGTKRQSFGEQLLAPGLCSPLEASGLLFAGTKGGAVAIGAFVTDVVYATNPLQDGKGGRLFLPVRGDATMHWIDVDDDTDGRRTGRALDCGQSGSSQACDQNHRRGADNFQENVRKLALPAEPYGVALEARPYAGGPANDTPAVVPSPDPNQPYTTYDEALVTTHQTTGQMTLFKNHWGGGATEDGPELDFVAAGLPAGALSVAAVPLPAFWVEFPSSVIYFPGFLTTFRNAAQVSLARYFPEPQAHPPRPFLDVSRSTAITVNSVGVDSRGIAIDNAARAACEAPTTGPCSPSALEAVAQAQRDAQMDPTIQAQSRFECLLARCEPIPLDVYVANRAPPSLILGQSPPNVPRTLTDDLPHFYQSISISAGPSRVVVGSVVDTTGKAARRVFVICFDSRRIFVYDPVGKRIETEIITGRGPHAFAVDIGPNLDVPGDEGNYAYAYVGHFSDSYLAVIDLDQRHTETYGKIVLNVGQRTPPRASK